MQHDDMTLDVSIEDNVSKPSTLLFGFQHLLALTGIWVFPVLIGQILHLDAQAVSWIIQACFFTTGLVTILQSSRILKLPVVQGPTGAFFIAVLTGGATYGMAATFGSMVVAGAIFMLLTIPLGNLGILGRLARFVASPVVFGTLLVIVGASLADVGLSGWFGIPGSPSYGAQSFQIAVVTALIIVACMVFGGKTLVRKGSLLWGIIGGTLVAWMTGYWSLPSLASASVLDLPRLLPFGFGVAWPMVVLMMLAFLHAGVEAMGIYSLLARWGGQDMPIDRVHRGLFSEFFGCCVGALFGGLGTTSYPENVGIIKVSRVASRRVTLVAGAFALALSFLPKLALLIAGLPPCVLAAASTILFGIIAVSGIQMLAKVDWDELNIAVAAPSFIIALGVSHVPADLLGKLSPAVSSFLKPMMLGTVLLVVLHILINHVARPWMARSRIDGIAVGEPAASSTVQH